MARSRSGTRGRRGPRKPPRRDGAAQRRQVQVADPRERGAIELPGDDHRQGARRPAVASTRRTSSASSSRAASSRPSTSSSTATPPRSSPASSATRSPSRRPAAATGAAGETDGEAPTPEAAKEVLFEEDDESLLQPRAPIVTVMGHVDHGKTSLLDAIRTTEVAAGERGGITQHIGASEVSKDGRRVVFLDTPGHEAFTAMRARGAKVTDIAVVVVAADDGVMPQTLEAINHATRREGADRHRPQQDRQARCQPGPGQDRAVRGRRDRRGVRRRRAARARVGQDPDGLDELLEMLLLVADLQELKANPKRAAIGTIVEAQLDKSRGPVATALIQTGTLRVGDVIVVGETYGKVRALENDKGKRITKAGPATPAVVLGLVRGSRGGRHPARRRRREGGPGDGRDADAPRSPPRSGEGSGRATLEDLYRQIQAGQAKELRIILKADVSGSLGAITHALDQLSTDEVRINVLHEGAGDITDNDIMLAVASNAIVVGFNTKITDTAAPGGRGRGRRRPACTTSSTSSPTTSTPRSRACSSPRSSRSSRAAPRCARSSGSARNRDRRLVRHRRTDRPRRRPGLAGRQGHRDRPDRVAATLPGRRSRGRRRASNAASAWRASTTSPKATSSSASRGRRSPIATPDLGRASRSLDRGAPLTHADRAHRRSCQRPG